MSFMSGFAAGFSDAYQKDQDRQAVAKQDAFRVAYDSYIKKKAQYDADRKEDEANVRTAKAIAQNTPGVPPGAWETVYGWISGPNGMTAEQAQERLERTKFATTDTPSMSDTATTASQANPSPGDKLAQQSAESGLTPSPEMPPNQQPAQLGPDGQPVPVAASSEVNPNNVVPKPEDANPQVDQNLGPVPPQQQQNGFDLGSIFDPKAIQQRQMAQANTAVMKAAGVNQDEFDRINSGYQFGSALEGNAPQVESVAPKTSLSNAANGFDPNKAIYAVYTDANGNKVANSGFTQPDGSFKLLDGTIIPKEKVASLQTFQEADDVANLTKDVAPQIKAAIQARTDTATLVTDVKSVSDLVQKNPEIARKVNLIPQALNFAQNEVSGFFDLFKKDPHAVTEGQIEQAARSYENALTGYFTDKLEMNASDGQLLAAKMTAIKFRIARLMNGPGALSESDVKAGMQVLDSNDPNIFLRQASSFVVSMITQTNRNLADTLKNDPMLDLARQRKIDVDKAFAPVESMLTAEEQDWYNKALASGQFDTSTAMDGNNQTNIEQPNEDVLATGPVDDAAIAKWGIPKEYKGQGHTFTIYKDGKLEVN